MIRRAAVPVADKHTRGQPTHEHETDETNENAIGRTTIPPHARNKDSADGRGPMADHGPLRNTA